MAFTNNDRFLILDTETTNDIECPLAYDIGFAVIDKNGMVYESHSFAIAEIFLDKDLMESAFFKDKIPSYWNDIKNGKRELKTWFNVRRFLHEIVKKYDIKIMVAHNSRFDYKALNNTQRYITTSKHRFYLPYGMEVWDSLKMAREIFGDNDEYGQFCFENGFMTKTNRRRFTAEILYRYLTNDVLFEEEHQGIDDVLIEKEIFSYCLNANPEINGRLWK